MPNNLTAYNCAQVNATTKDGYSDLVFGSILAGLTGIVVCLGGYSTAISALRIGRTVTATTSKLSGMAYQQLSNHSPKFIKRAFSPRHNTDSPCTADDKHIVIELESPRRRTHRFTQQQQQQQQQQQEIQTPIPALDRASDAAGHLVEDD
jgi:hypothetical protein